MRSSVTTSSLIRPQLEAGLLRFAIALGMVLGMKHFLTGIGAIFVFKHDETALSWLMVLLGPLSVFPAAAVGLFWPVVGAVWLTGGAVVSGCLFSFGPHRPVEAGQILRYCTFYAAPMIAMAALELRLGNIKRRNHIGCSAG